MPDEDQVILDLKSKGLSWPDIAVKLKGRSSEQVRQRFLYALDPNRKKSVPWSEEEDFILQKYQALQGNTWTIIAKFLPGRSDNDVKNRWYNLKTRSERIMKRAMLKSPKALRLEKLDHIRALHAPMTNVQYQEDLILDQSIPPDQS